MSALLRSAANLYWLFGEKETDLSIRAKEIFSLDLRPKIRRSQEVVEVTSLNFLMPYKTPNTRIRNK